MKAYPTLTLALAVIMLGACHKEHAELVPMTFSASQTAAADASTAASQGQTAGKAASASQSRTTAAGQAAPATKAGWTTIGKDDLTKYSFGIFGGYSATKGGALTNLFDDNKAVEVSYNTSGSEGKWEYSPVKNWRRNSHYRFRAYCPYDAEVLPSTSDADNISIEYRIIDHQYDLLVAFAHRCPATDSEGYDPVNMAFQHALSGLRFQVFFDESVPNGQTDQIISFHLKGLRPAGTLLYSHENGNPLNPELEWSAKYFDENTEYYNCPDKAKFGKGTPVNVFPDNNGVVFAIPQAIEAGKTSVHFTTANGTMDHTATLPAITWEPGKIYTYTLKVLKSSVEVNVGIKDWDEVQSSVEVYL